MMTLVTNEWRKLLARKSSWILQIILVALMIISAVFLMSISNMISDTDDSSGNGVTVYQTKDGKTISEEQYQAIGGKKTTQYKKEVLSPKKSVSYLKQSKKTAVGKEQRSTIQKEIDYYQAYVDANKTPDVPKGYSSAAFFSDLGGMSFISLIMVVIVSSMMVAMEFSGGTIKLLLTRPYTRSQILLSKLIVTLLYGLATLLILIISCYLCSLILPHQSAFLPLGTYTGALTAFDVAIRSIAISFVLMIVYASLSFFFSSVIRSQALAIGVGLGVMFASNIISTILQFAVDKYDWLKWIFFNLLNLNSYSTGEKISGNLDFWQALVGLGIYTVVILGLSFYIFKKRDVSLT